MLAFFFFKLLLPIVWSKGNKARMGQDEILHTNKKTYENYVPSSTIKEDIECPSSDGFDVIIIPNSYMDEKEVNKRVYSCNNEFTVTLPPMENSILSLYLCKFTGLSQCAITYTVSSPETGQYAEIVGCTFAKSFTNPIKFSAPKGIIKQCSFSDNLIFGGNIIYDYDPQGVEYSEGLVITENTLEVIDNPSGFLYFTYHPKSVVEITNNKFKTAYPVQGAGIYLFDCPTPCADVQWKIQGNCFTPGSIFDIKSNNAAALEVTIDECTESGGGDGGGEENDNCPDDPGEYLNSQIYTYTCGNSFDYSPGFDAQNTILAIFYSTFTNIGSTSQQLEGSIIKVVTSKDLTNLKDPMKLIDCHFEKCYCHDTSLISIESAEQSRTFEIKNCTFSECYGGIQIKAKGACFDFQNCSFNIDHLKDGCITYETLSASSSMNLLEEGDPVEFNYLISVYNCTFKGGSSNDNGAAICIKITEELKKPILINDCSFHSMYAGGRDQEDQEKGGCIYFSYSPSSSASSSKALLEDATDDFSLKIVDCTFTFNTAIIYGGSIYLEVLNKELPKPIEINHCSFSDNKIDNLEEVKTGSGGDVYYVYQSSETSTVTGDALKFINCDFSRSETPDFGGSLYILVEGASSKTITLNECTFTDCFATKGNAIDIISTHSTAFFKFDTCHFMHKSSINFNAINGEIVKCDFTNITKPIRYDCNSNVAATESSPYLKIESCTFKQNEEVQSQPTFSLIYLVPKVSSNLIFKLNSIDLTDIQSTFIIDSDSITNLVGSWTFESNTLIPKKKSLIKTQNADLIPVKCEAFGFKCVDCPKNDKCYIDGDDGYEAIEQLDISNSIFTNLKSNDDHGGAIYIKNWGLTGKDTTFDGCEALPKEGDSGHAGGGIYLYIDKPIGFQISLELIEFKNCKAFYGGAFYAYCSIEDIKVTITKCTFTSNHASTTAPKTGDANLFGGSAIFQSCKKAVILRSKFKSNVGAGVKLYNVFEENGASQLNSETSMISISDCEFEANELASNSIFYVHPINNEIPTKVVNCLFTGKLANDAHHIDGTYTSNDKKKKNLFVESCLFSDGIDKALNVNVASVDMKSNKFNYNEKTTNIPLVPVLAIFSVVSAAVVIVVVVILLKRNNDSQEEEEECNEA